MRFFFLLLLIMVAFPPNASSENAGALLMACLGYKPKPRPRFDIEPYVPKPRHLMAQAAHRQWLAEFAPDLDFGVANTERTAGVYWLMARSAFAGKIVPRWAKEVVALAVSRFNQSAPGQAGHAQILMELGDADLARVLTCPLDQEPEFIGQDAARAQIYYDWVKYHFFPRHVPKQMPPAQEIAELSAVLSVVQYQNAMANVFASSPKTFRGASRPSVRMRDHKEGLERLILPAKRDAPFPADIKWAEPGSSLDQSFAEAATLMRTIKTGLSKNIPLNPNTQQVVEEIILTTRGNGLLTCRRRMAHLEEQLRGKVSLPELKIARAITRSGIAPYDADNCQPLLTVVAEAREVVPAGAAFIEMVSWASYLGMRRIQAPEPPSAP